mmetsp:Transcript_14761/g.46524  ORF Transcript_14761/g.46524 Transcript_14761/m.46524 type:complete len:235 (-) Transcript_14761:427-1131(-)
MWWSQTHASTRPPIALFGQARYGRMCSRALLRCRPRGCGNGCSAGRRSSHMVSGIETEAGKAAQLPARGDALRCAEASSASAGASSWLLRIGLALAKAEGRTARSERRAAAAPLRMASTPAVAALQPPNGGSGGSSGCSGAVNQACCNASLAVGRRAGSPVSIARTRFFALGDTSLHVAAPKAQRPRSTSCASTSSSSAANGCWPDRSTNRMTPIDHTSDAKPCSLPSSTSGAM